jgi:hypothetical protein
MIGDSGGFRRRRRRRRIIGGSSGGKGKEKAKADQDVVSPHSIDGSWVRRQISETASSQACATARISSWNLSRIGVSTAAKDFIGLSDGIMAKLGDVTF